MILLLTLFIAATCKTHRLYIVSYKYYIYLVVDGVCSRLGMITDSIGNLRWVPIIIELSLGRSDVCSFRVDRAACVLSGNM